jgi:AAA domain
MDEKTLEQLKSMGGAMTLADVPRLIRPFIYGDPGVGKTQLAAEICLEVGLNPIWVTSDSGWSTVLKYPDLAKRTYKVLFDSFEHIRLMVQAKEEGLEPFCNYDTVVLDTVSTQISMMLRTVTKLKPLPGEQKDPSIPGWGHYQMIENAMKDTVEVLSKSGMHVIYLAHIRDPTEKDKEKKRFAIRPAGPEATYRIIAQEANLIGWLHKENRDSERLIQFSPTLQETAKTQVPTILEQTYSTKLVPELISKYINS